MAVSPDALICVRTEKCGISKSVRRQAAAESSLESILGGDGKKRQKASSPSAAPPPLLPQRLLVTVRAQAPLLPLGTRTRGTPHSAAPGARLHD